MSRDISDVLRIMRLAIGRRNELDPDSNDSTLLQYIKDFMSLTMSDEVKIVEQWRSFTMEIDETTTDGVFTFPGASTATNFVNIIPRAMISLLSPQGESVSWYSLWVYQDPEVFYEKWGINNEDILTTGQPTDMLYYGNEFIFRTIPDTDYLVKFYGYQSVTEPSSTTEELPFDYWLRFIAYGAAMEYASDYRLGEGTVRSIEKGFKKARKQLLTRTHNQTKTRRCQPRF